MSELPDLPRTWRPLGPRIAGAVGGGALVAILAMLWISFDENTKQAVTPFQRGTAVLMFGLGLACLHALARCRVTATEDALVVVNGYRSRRLEWPQVIAIRLRPGQPWATLDLNDGSTVSVMALQGSDGARARQGVAALRALLDRPYPPGH
ncbi:PH domain-containing protein [Nocardioides sp.]|uniref:PH domain-containing protein n=1 Tax=Nocardioides sp. TaxID=35761 RepID=UPI00351856BB